MATPSKLTKTHKEKIRELAAQGLSAEHIAVKFAVSDTAIRNVVYRQHEAVGHPWQPAVVAPVAINGAWQSCAIWTPNEAAHG